MRFLQYRTQRQVALATPGIDDATAAEIRTRSNLEYATRAFQRGRHMLHEFRRTKVGKLFHDLIDEPAIRDTIQTTNEGIAELTWFNLNRPFYNVYPVVLGMIDGVKLTLPFSQVRLPFDSMLFQFPADACPSVLVAGVQRRLCSVLWYCGADYLTPESNDRMYVCIPSFEHDVVPHFFLFADDCEQEVEEYLQMSKDGARAAVQEDEKLRGHAYDGRRVFDTGISAIDQPLMFTLEYDAAMEWCFRLLVLVSLLNAGEDLITPVLLSKDQQDADLLGPAAAEEWIRRRAEKARQRGVFGFDVGKELQKEKERSPHFRNPHLALFHVGPGRTEARVQLRRGAVVISKALTQVPTGFLGPETVEEREACERVVVREPISTRTRFFILKRDGYRCQICGADAKTDTAVQLHIDHKTAVANGGSSDISNLWVLCSHCNLGKGTSDL